MDYERVRYSTRRIQNVAYECLRMVMVQCNMDEARCSKGVKRSWMIEMPSAEPRERHCGRCVTRNTGQRRTEVGWLVVQYRTVTR